jgi:hypothetical protein
MRRMTRSGDYPAADVDYCEGFHEFAPPWRDSIVGHRIRRRIFRAVPPNERIAKSRVS